jgi:hypothetical protein
LQATAGRGLWFSPGLAGDFIVAGAAPRWLFRTARGLNVAKKNSTESEDTGRLRPTVRDYLRGDAGEFALIVTRLHAGFTVILTDPATLESEIRQATTFAEAWLALAPPIFVEPSEQPIIIHDKGRDPDWLDKSSEKPALIEALSPIEQVIDLLRREPGDRFSLSIMRRDGYWVVQFAGYGDVGAKEVYGRTFSHAWTEKWHPDGPARFRKDYGAKT